MHRALDASEDGVLLPCVWQGQHPDDSVPMTMGRGLLPSNPTCPWSFNYNSPQKDLLSLFNQGEPQGTGLHEGEDTGTMGAGHHSERDQDLLPEVATSLAGSVTGKGVLCPLLLPS